MIMSSFTQIEMSALNNGKVPLFKSKEGYIARKPTTNQPKFLDLTLFS